MILFDEENGPPPVERALYDQVVLENRLLAQRVLELEKDVHARRMRDGTRIHYANEHDKPVCGRSGFDLVISHQKRKITCQRCLDSGVMKYGRRR